MKILQILSAQERQKGVWALAAATITAVLDLLGLAIIFPILGFFLKGDQVSKSTILWFCLGAMVFAILKNLATVLLSRSQNRYLFAVGQRISKQLFSNYFSRGLLYVRDQGAMRLAHNVNYAGSAYAMGILGSLLRLFAESLLILLVTAVGLWYAPKVVGVLYLVFLPFCGVYIWQARALARRHGKLEQDERRGQVRLVQNAFRGYAEWEVGDAFALLYENFSSSVGRVNRSKVQMETLSRLPMGLLEVAVVIGLSILLFVGSGEMGVYLPSAFALVAFRLLPAVRNVVSCVTTMSNMQPWMPFLEEGLGMGDEETGRQGDEETGKQGDEESNCSHGYGAHALTFEKCVELKDLTFRYTDGSRLIEGFNLTVAKGAHIGISGVSGVGKSTLFYLLLGLVEPLGGQVLIDGVALDKSTRATWLHRVGYVAQQVFVVRGTVAENVALGLQDIDRARVEKVLREVNLGDWLDALSGGLDTELSEDGNSLSGGQKQRLGIARALYKGADVLLMDEATSALDSATESSVNEMLCSLRDEAGAPLTILTIAHRESTLERCDQVVRI